MTPSWLLDIFAALMLIVAGVSVVRLILARSRVPNPSRRADIDAAHVLMGMAMAGMLVAGLATLPNLGWEVAFAALAAWFGWRVATGLLRTGMLRTGKDHDLTHLAHSGAMTYMFAAISGPAQGTHAGTGGMAMAGNPAGTLQVPELAFAFLILLAALTVTDIDQMNATARPTIGTGGGSAASPPVRASLPALVGAGITSIVPVARGGSAEVQPAAAGQAEVLCASGTMPPGWTGRPGLLVNDRTAVICRVVTGVTMLFTLAIMI